MDMSDSEQWKDRFDETAAKDDGKSEGKDGGEGCGCGCAGQAVAGTEAQDKGGESCCMPKPTFSTFVLSLASSALVQLGEVPDPSTGEQREDPVLAKHTIDLLSMLDDKIKNGLDAEEARLLEGLLYELRMKFVMKK